MTRIYLVLSALFVLALGFTATAFAGEATADGSLTDLVRPVYDAIHGGQYWLGASLALVLLVTAFKRYAPEGKMRDFAHSDVGGTVLVLLGAFGGALATGLLAAGTSAVSLALAWTALKIAIGASGGYSIAKKLLVDPLKASDWYLHSAPMWLKSLLDLAMWAFVKPDIVGDAEQAGAAAVAAAPSAGANGAAGAPTDL